MVDREVAFRFTGRARSGQQAAQDMERALQRVEKAADHASRNASASLGRMSREGSAHANNLERSLRRLTTRAAIGLAGLGAAAGALATFSGLSFYRTRQSAEIAFGTMLRSGTRAKAFLDDLAKFAAATPFEFPELIQASQKLLAVGFSAEKIIPIMTDVGNAVAAMGGDPEVLQSTIRAIGQIQSKGRLMAEEMMQLGERGVFSWQSLAHELGVSVPQAMELVTKGAVTADMFMAAFQRSTQERFDNMMERQSHTFSGLLSTLRDTFSQTSERALRPLFDLATRGMQRIADETGKPEFTAGVERFARAVETDVVPALKDAVQWVIDNRREIAEWGEGAVEKMTGFATALGRVTRGLGAISDLMGGWDNLFTIILTGYLSQRVLGLARSFGVLAGAEAAAGAAGTAGGTGIAGAAGQATRLRSVLLSLSRLGAIAIPITLFIYKNEIEDWMRAHGLGWAAGGGLIEILTNIDASGAPGAAQRGRGSQAPGSREARNRSADVNLSGTRGTVFPIPSSSRSTADVAGGPAAHSGRGSGWQSTNAVDIFAQPGTPVVAPQDGEVAKVTTGSARQRTTASGAIVYGSAVTIRAFRGGQVWYIAHLDDVVVREGDRVARGSIIGYVSAWLDANGRPRSGTHAHVAVKVGTPQAALGGAAHVPVTGAAPAGARASHDRPLPTQRSAPSRTTQQRSAPGGAPGAGRGSSTVERGDPGGGRPLYGQACVNYIASRCLNLGLDPDAVLAVASVEGGFNGAVGDGGTSFGPFQLHAGGALPAEVWKKGAIYARRWANTPEGLDYALDKIAAVAGGKSGGEAVNLIVRKFERPARPGAEVAKATGRLGSIPYTADPRARQGAPGGADIADAASIKGMQGQVAFVLSHLDRVLPAARGRMREMALAIRAAIAGIVTDDDARKVAGRVEKLIRQFEAAASIKRTRDALKTQIQAMLEQIARLPEDMWPRLGAAWSKVNKLIARIVDAKSLAAAQAGIEDLAEQIAKGIADTQGRFDKAWGRFRDRIMRAFDEGVVGKFRLAIEFGEEVLGRAAAQKAVDRARGVIAEIETAVLSEQEQAVKQRAETLAAAQAEYYAALESGDRDRIDRAGAALVEAQDQWSSIDQSALDERGQKYLAAWQRFLEASDKLSQGALAQAQKRWEETAGENRDELEDFLDGIAQQLKDGEITWAEARSRTAAELAKYGIDLDNIGSMMGDVFQTALIDSINAVAKAVEDLVRALGGVKPAAEDAAGAIARIPPPPRPEPGRAGGPAAPEESGLPPAAVATGDTAGGSRGLNVQVDVMVQAPVTVTGALDLEDFAAQVAEPIRNIVIRKGAQIAGDPFARSQ